MSLMVTINKNPINGTQKNKKKDIQTKHKRKPENHNGKDWEKMTATKNYKTTKNNSLNGNNYIAINNYFTCK